MSIIIKRYRNRKLYNTRSKRYVTLEQIEQLIKEHEEVKVIDNFTSEDITATTLSQIIFELQKSRAGFLPQNLLFSLVQSGGDRMEEIRRNIFNSLNLSHHYDVEIERRIDELIERGELDPQDGSRILKKLLDVGPRRDGFIGNVEERITDLLREQQIPSKNDLQALIQKIEMLSERVEEFKNNNEEEV